MSQGFFDQRTFWMATTALGLALSASQSHKAGAQTIQLPAVSVEENKGDEEYKVDQPSMTKLTQPLLETPQTINVVPKQVLQDQGITTLRDALRNVSGISLSAGEGGRQGDSISIRGFSAANDFYMDGMNDFGSYYRDPFNLDQVEVLTGPSSVLFGRGSTGGVVNQVSKTPGLTPFVAGSASLGTNMTTRMTADVNTPVPSIGPGVAFRANLMVHRNEFTERDEAENTRFGFAPSLAFGLGTDTRTTLSYYHFQENDIPDYGVPWIDYRGQNISNPAPVDGSNFYGFANDDFLKTNVDIVTGKIEHDIDETFSVRDQLRFANYERDFRITEPQLLAAQGAPFASGTDLSSVNINRNIIRGSGTETFLENQLDLTSKFDTGFVNHTLVTGIAIGRQTSHPVRYNYSGVPGTNLADPNSGTPFSATSESINSGSSAYTKAYTTGIYAIDTLKLNEQWSLLGSIRYDRFDASYENRNGLQIDSLDEMPSGRGAIVYKPFSYASAYVQYGTSFNPSAEGLSSSAASGTLPPEENETWETGTKWDLFKNKLSLTGALFRVEKVNARETVAGSTLQQLAGNIVVDGVTLGVTGRLTDEWQIFTGYTYQDGEVESSPAADKGNRPSGLPRNSFSLWSTYDLTQDYQVGGGINYVGARFASNTRDTFGQRREVDEYWTAQLMGKYRLTDNTDIQLNIYNLFDADYYDQLHPSHVVPGEGRTAILSTNFKF